MPTVLVADPNATFVTVVADALQRLSSVAVVTAASGPEALRQAAAARPQLAVIDGGLPECDVMQLITALRRELPDLPVVLLPLDAGQLPAAPPVQGVLAKPFFLPDLAALVTQILGPAPASAPPAAGPDVSLAKPRPTFGAASHTALLRSRLGVPEPAPAPAPTPAPARPAPPPLVLPDDVRRRVESRVETLSRALRDEPVFLTQGERMVVMVPRLSASAAGVLVDVVRRAWEASEPPREVIRFEGESDNTRYMLYSVRVSATRDLILSAALRARIPLTILRRVVQETALDLAGLLPS